MISKYVVEENWVHNRIVSGPNSVIVCIYVSDEMKPDLTQKEGGAQNIYSFPNKPSKQAIDKNGDAMASVLAASLCGKGAYLTVFEYVEYCLGITSGRRWHFSTIISNFVHFFYT